MERPRDSIRLETAADTPEAYYARTIYAVTFAVALRNIPGSHDLDVPGVTEKLDSGKAEDLSSVAMHPDVLTLIMTAVHESLTAQVESFERIDGTLWPHQDSNVKHFLEQSFKAFCSYDLGQSSKIIDALFMLERKRYLNEWRRLPMSQLEHNVRRLLLNLADAFIVLDLLAKTSKGLWAHRAKHVAESDATSPAFFALVGAAMALQKSPSFEAPKYLGDRWKLLKRQIVRAGPGQDYGYVANLFANCITYAITGKGSASLQLPTRREQRLAFSQAWDWSSSDSETSEVVAPPKTEKPNSAKAEEEHSCVPGAGQPSRDMSSGESGSGYDGKSLYYFND